jgi:hypothetical protein
MTTLLTALNDTDEILELAGYTSGAITGEVYRIEDELVVLQSLGTKFVGATSYPDPSRWNIRRGEFGTVKVAHNAGVTVNMATAAFATGGSLTPADPFAAGGAGATPTLAEVLAAGNTTGERFIVGLSGKLVLDEDVMLIGQSGDAPAAGGLIAGDHTDGGLGGRLQATAGVGASHGRVGITTDGSTGTIGQVLIAQGDSTAIWATPLANIPAIDTPVGSGETTLNALLLALKTSGLMVADA